MKLFRRIQRKIKAQNQLARERRIRERYGESGLAHQCMHCKWFVYRVEKPRNWVCRCPPEKMRFAGGTCLGMEFGEHPEMVLFNSR